LQEFDEARYEWGAPRLAQADADRARAAQSLAPRVSHFPAPDPALFTEAPDLGARACFAWGLSGLVFFFNRLSLVTTAAQRLSNPATQPHTLRCVYVVACVCAFHLYRNLKRVMAGAGAPGGQADETLPRLQAQPGQGRAEPRLGQV
jgi:hypothetical protein